MGMCYSVTYSLNIKDEKKALKKLKEYVNTFTGKIVNNFTFDEIMGLVLEKEDRFSNYSQSVEENTKIYESDFDASYTWNILLMDIFYELAPFLENDSFARIYADNDFVKLTKKGEAIQERRRKYL